MFCVFVAFRCLKLSLFARVLNDFAQLFSPLGMFSSSFVGFKRFSVNYAWVLSDFMHWESILVRRHVGFKRLYGLRAHLLCTGMWGLRG